MSLDPAKTCPECGAELPVGTVPGQCPHCLLGLGLAVADAEAEGRDQKSEGRGQRAEVRGQRAEVRGQRAEGRGQRTEDEGRRPEDGEPKSGANNQPNASDAPLAARHSPLATTFGDYELLEEIARGGMGVIYKARQKSLDRIVALKMMLAEHLATKEQFERFRTEAQAAAQLRHPHIVAIHEVGEHAGQHFFSMDFVPGRNLAQIIADPGFRVSDFKRSARWMRAIAQAVHHAHERGVLHRDLKPSNILIDEEDQPRITDFGLAKRFTGSSELTLTGQVLGSPNYLSPEQAAGTHAKVGPASDVYALGAILYHLSTGRPPFQADSLTTLLRQVVDTEPVAPRRLNPSIPRDLETVCLKCLEKEPGRRYGTAQNLAEESGRFLEGKPVLARPVGRMAKVWRWCRRNPRLALTTGAALLSLLIGLAGVTWQWGQAQSERARAEAEALLARLNAYAADMNLVQQALEAGELGRARELLNRHRPVGKSEIPNPKSEIDLRGWEWRYLWARCQSEERFTLHQYSNSVWALAFSPESPWLAVRPRATVALWDNPARRLVAELPLADVCASHKALAFSPRGNLLACGNQDATGTPAVSFWDLGAEKETARFPTTNCVVSLSFSPDAEELATFADDGTVLVWDVASQRVTTNFVTKAVKRTASQQFEDRFPAVASAPKAMAKGAERTSSTGRPVARGGPMDTDHYGCVLFSPDGRWLALGEVEPRIRLWDRATGRERRALTVPMAHGITALAFSSDGRRLAAGFGFGYNIVHVWDLETQTEQCLAGHTGWVAALAFSPDGQTLASVGVDQSLRLWDLTGEAEPRRFQGNTAEIWAVAWSPDGKELVTGAKDGSVRYWDPHARPAKPYEILDAAVWPYGLTYLPDSQSFLTVNLPDGEVMRWDAATLQKLETLSFLGTNYLNVHLTQDGRWLTLSQRTGNVHIWDFAAGRFVTNLAYPEAGVILAARFSPGGHYVHSGAYASDWRVLTKAWEVASWHKVSLDGIDLRDFSGFDVSCDERTVAVGYNNGTAAWWDIVTRTRQGFFACGPPGVTLVRFSRDGKRFATAQFGGLITLWDVATRQPTPVGLAYASSLHGLCFSPDARRLLTTGTSPRGLVKVWDDVTGRDVATLPGEPGFFPVIDFSPDGKTLFAISISGTALFWRAPSWEEIEKAESRDKGR